MTQVQRETKSWRVEPVGPLRGEVTVAGAKNAVTKHMVAAVLAGGPCVIDNAPDVGDVLITGDMLEALGAQVLRDGPRVVVDATTLTTPDVPTSFSGRNRIPILLLGPLLHRHGEAFVPLVGGDQIGTRPVDFHVEALRNMGAEIETSPEGVHAKAVRLHGARIRLPFPSVGATETVLLSAVGAEGRTVIENAAIEPEIVELALFLQRMGAQVELRPNRRWVVEGVPALGPASHRLAGDRLEAFSYLVAALITDGEVAVRGVRQDDLVTALTTLRRMGADLEIVDDYVKARGGEALRAVAVHTDTHPGFMTDWQQPLAVLATQAHGLSVIHETVFEERFGYVDALRTMGAEIELFDQCLGGPACRFHETDYLHSAVIRGRSPLIGADIRVPDVRGGFAYLLAAAVADGPSRLSGVGHVERGYHRPVEQFRSLGLVIEEDDSPGS